MGVDFVAAMLLMASSGAVMAAVRSVAAVDPVRATKFLFDAMGGVLTFYLVTTALLTVRRPARAALAVDVGAMLVALAVAIIMTKGGFDALASARATTGGYPAPQFFVFGSVALLAALGDLRMIAARGAQGVRRLARHLWRMGFAMFIATSSFFLGQARVFPEPLRILPLLAVPVVLVLVALAYWVVRVRLLKRPPRSVTAAAPGLSFARHA